MMPVAAPADRRFRRAHVKPARRRLHWRAVAVPVIKTLAVVGLVVYGAWRGAEIVSHAQMLQVNHIVVRGNERLSPGEVTALLNGLRGQSLLWTDLDLWRERLLSSPWVRDASLRRALPSTVEVVIEERQPAGIGRVRGDMYLIDDHGAAIDQYGPQYADLDLPIIDGLPAASQDLDAQADAKADLAMRVMAAVKAKPEVARRVSQIDVTDVHDARVIVSGDTAVIHLGDEQFLQRLESYLQLAPTLHERVADIDYVDLRFNDRVYVRPTGKPPALPRPRGGVQGRDGGARRARRSR